MYTECKAVQWNEGQKSLVFFSWGLFLISLLLGTAAMNVGAALVFLVGIHSLIRSENLRRATWLIVKSPFVVLFPLFLLIFLLTLLINQRSLEALSEVKWLLYSFLFIPPMIVTIYGEAPLYQKKSGVKVIVWEFRFLIALLIMVAMYGILQYFTHYDILRGESLLDSEGGRSRGFLRNPIPFSQVMAVYLTVAWLFVIQAIRQGSTLAAVSIYLISLFPLVAVYCSQTRSSWLALGPTVISAIFLAVPQVRRVFLLIVSAHGFLGIVLVLVDPKFQSRLNSLFDATKESNRIRLEMWTGSWEMLKDYPFGVGFDHNDVLLPSYFNELGFTSIGDTISHPHNEFIDILVSTGWVGGIIYLSITFFFLLMALRCLLFFRKLGIVQLEFIAFGALLIQIFLNGCAMMDQFNTPGRLIMSMCWAGVLVLDSLRRGVLGDCLLAETRDE